MKIRIFRKRLLFVRNLALRIYKKIRAFTLIEIMVVIGVITIILALALPSMLRSRLNANELAAISNCRLIATSCQSYYGNIAPNAYPARFSDLIAPASNPAYIDDVLASGTKQGYTFLYNRPNTDSFVLYANPVRVGRTGVRYFYVDEIGVIRSRTGGRAGPTDPPVSG